MAPVAVGFGILLTVVGVVGYVLTERVSTTALIPTWFGIALLVLGVLAYKDSLRKHAMHLAALVGLVGFLGSAAMGLPKLATLLSGGEVERPAAVLSQSLMAVCCAVFVGLCVKSFIDARRARNRAAGGTLSESSR
jgi:hypothetical protein